MGRIGGDEFAVFIAVPSIGWTEKKAGELSKEMQYQFTEGSKSSQISVSIGVALAPDAGTDFDRLYKNADKALYATKKGGKQGHTVYGSDS